MHNLSPCTPSTAVVQTAAAPVPAIITQRLARQLRWRRHAVVCCWLGLVACTRPVLAQRPLQVHTDFEGGSARVLDIDDSRSLVALSPGGNPERGWACWWSARIEHLEPGQTLTLEVQASPLPTRNNGQLTDRQLDASWCMPAQAMYSHDGRSWKQTPVGVRTGSSMRYQLQAEGPQLWVAWGPPFTPDDTERLIAAVLEAAEADTHLTVSAFTLARTLGNRPVRALRIGAASHAGDPGSRTGVHASQTEDTAPQAEAAGENQPSLRPGIWIQARQHAWESGSSWVADGLAQWLVSDEPAARWLASHVEIVIVPIMDVDNVATGNGGKEENPRDHNRDWDDLPVHPAVAAAQRELLAWADAGRLDLFLDLHNPAPQDLTPFFFCGPDELLSPVARANRGLFLASAAKQISDPLPVQAVPRVTGPSYHPLWRKISGQWVSDHGNPHTVSLCLETSWNTPHSTTAGYRTVGAQLGRSIAEYMQQRSR
jgi:hypothetical protein